MRYTFPCPPSFSLPFKALAIVITALFFSLGSFLSAAVSFTTQPVDVEVTEGENTSFSVAVDEADGATYQWVRTPNVDYDPPNRWFINFDKRVHVPHSNVVDDVMFSGATTSELSLTGVTADMAGEYYWCVVTVGEDSLVSDCGRLVVNRVPLEVTAIVSSPSDAVATEGSTVFFNVLAIGPSVLSYQWQMQAVEESNWEDLSNDERLAGTDESRLIINDASNILDGAYFRCLVATGNGLLESESAELSFKDVPSLAIQGIANIDQLRSLTAISSDGSTIAGQASTPEELVEFGKGAGSVAFLRTEASANLMLQGWSSLIVDLSADGSFAVGSWHDFIGSNTFGGRFHWDGVSDRQPLPLDVVSGLSNDGMRVVGQANFQAAWWTEEHGNTFLGDFPGGLFQSEVAAVSADGEVLAGYGIDDEGFKQFIWSESTGMVPLDIPVEPYPIFIAEISADGSTFVCHDTSDAKNVYLWNASSGLLPFGDKIQPLPHEELKMRARAISGNGSLVGGSVSVRNEGEHWKSRAVVWSPDGVAYDLTRLLLSQGTDLDGWTFTEVSDMTPDGDTLICTGYREDSYNRMGWILTGFNSVNLSQPFEPDAFEILSITVVGNDHHITVELTPGLDFQLQRKESLSDSDWIEHGDPVAGDGRHQLTFIHEGAALLGPQFYRVVALGQES